MQQKSAEKSSLPERLKKLRLKTQQNWSEIAKMLAISESMLYQVLRGDRALSDKASFRLEALEGHSGLLWQDSDTKSMTDTSIRNWIWNICQALEPPEIAFFLTAVVRVGSAELQQFLERYQLRLEQKEVITPNDFDLVVNDNTENSITIGSKPKKGK